jgi:hypothetical protein
MKAHCSEEKKSKLTKSPKNYMIQSIALTLKSYPIGRRLAILSKLIQHSMHENSPCIKCEILREYRVINPSTK